MIKYKVTYITKNDTLGTAVLNAYNLAHLSQLIVRNISDMKDDDADNIIKTEKL